MHCYICVTYLMIIATAHPPKHREVSKSIEKRSIFKDVIQSLRIRSQLPEDINLNDENNIGQNDDKYEYDNEPLQLPSDIEFLPRRNDRIEMPSLKYRFPKSLTINDSDENMDHSTKEVVLYISTPAEYSEIKTTTQKPKKQKQPRPTVNKNKVAIKNKDESESETDIEADQPFMNTMGGQSQIGNRESQTVVKPTVIVNFRGSVMHRESDIKLEKRKSKNDTMVPNNIFNIKQEINLERHGISESGDLKKVPPKVKQNVKIVSHAEKARIEEDMMMCETASWKDKKGKEDINSKRDVLQILVSI